MWRVDVGTRIPSYYHSTHPFFSFIPFFQLFKVCGVNVHWRYANGFTGSHVPSSQVTLRRAQATSAQVMLRSGPNSLLSRLSTRLGVRSGDKKGDGFFSRYRSFRMTNMCFLSHHCLLSIVHCSLSLGTTCPIFYFAPVFYHYNG